MKQVLQDAGMYDGGFEIIDWCIHNTPRIEELIAPLQRQKRIALESYHKDFHDVIREQYEELVLSVVGIEACTALGCSVEQFHVVVTDIFFTELLDNHGGIYDT